MTSRIDDYAMVGDLETAALIGRDGSIDWLCLPRFDSPACFAAMLGTERDGAWRLSPVDGVVCTSRSYRSGALVLETRWQTDDGSATVIDLMPPRNGSPELIRIIEGTSGRVDMESVLRLRFQYGDIQPWVTRTETGVRAVAGPHAAWIASSVPLEEDDRGVCSRFSVRAGERATFVLTYQSSEVARPPDVDPDKALEQTMSFWTDWISKDRYEGRWGDDVRSALVLLKALIYAPTGGIVAAPTTSLPECIGGTRNWDYRYCWVRDAAFTLQALVGSGYVEEAEHWREWLVRAVAGDPGKLQNLYRVDGDRDLPERIVDSLPGHAGSAPVRIGNAAAGQLQIDEWGEVLNTMYLAREAGLDPTDSAWDLQRRLLDWLESNWRQPDNGLWELRGPRQHHVHSKVLAWCGLDRAVRTVDSHGLDGPMDRWRALRDEIHREVCRQGYDPVRGTFTQFYGATGVDAALLLLPRVGFVRWDDPRMLGTIEAIREDLSRDGLLLRYDTDAGAARDGIPEPEGAFVACTFWLVDALHETGRTDEAIELFERLLSLRNDVGLISEEYDIHHGRQLGNTPQAYSLVGIVNSAHRLSGSSMDPDAV